MQAVCRDFRDNKAGFFAVSAPMIISAGSKAGRSGLGAGYDQLWQGRGSPAAQDRGPPLTL